MSENKTIIVYLDDKDNEVSAEEATKMNIVEYDENGNRVKETFMSKTVDKPEEAKKYWDSVEVNKDSEAVKSFSNASQKPNPIQDFLDSQKIK